MPHRRPPADAPKAGAGVYVTLADLTTIEHRVRGIGLLPKQPVNSLLAGRRASRLRGRGMDFEEIRAYQPGDDVRSIDWKVTARTRKPHTRVFTEERDRPALVIVDQRINMFVGTTRAMKSVVAAELAAAAAWRTFAQGDRLGGLVFDDDDVVALRPHRSRDAVTRLLKTVATKNQALRVGGGVTTNPGRLDEVLARADRLAGHDHLVMVFSDFDGVGDETRQHVSQLARRNDVLLFLVHDPAALDLPTSGRLVVSDGDLQVEVDLGTGTGRRRMLEYTEGRIQRVLGWQRELGVPVLPIDTGSDPLKQVGRLLGSVPPLRRRGRGR
jgi:uncharacterized protein (DUF58 family)